jgi:hypothetical protein
VDQDLFVFEKYRQSEKYDVGTINFRAKPGKLIYLDKVHESIWATRLSGGTRSGVISLEVTAVGDVTAEGKETVLKVQGADREFILVDDVKAKPADTKQSSYTALSEAMSRGEKVVQVTGYVDGWVGRWPTVLRTPPADRPRLMVTSFEVAGEDENE